MTKPIDSKSHGATSTLKEEKKVPLWRIILCTFAMCGIQVCYAAQINFGTAQLLFLGLSEESVSIAWLAGPISGLVVQPLIGIASDSCTNSLGRRRPFLIVGTILTVMALIMFSNAINIARVVSLGSDVSNTALKVAIFSFFLLDFSIQAIQAPLRALVTDIIPKSQRTVANSYIGMFTGLGNLLGGILASLTLTEYLTFFENDVQALFTVSALIVSFTVLTTCTFSVEERLIIPNFNSLTDIEAPSHISGFSASDELVTENSYLLIGNDNESDHSDNNQNHSEPVSVRNSLKNIPSPFWKVFSVQLCTWCGFFTLFVYLNSWVGTNIFRGDGNAPQSSDLRKRFEDGVQLGGKGNAIMAIVTLLFSLFLPTLIKRIGVLKVYVLSQVTEAVCLLLAPVVRARGNDGMPGYFLKSITLIDISMFGIVWAVTMTVPWTLIGDALESSPQYSKNIGIYTTLFNASQSFPQLVVAVVAPFILSSFNDDPSYVMFTGGVLAFLGAFLAVVLEIGENPNIDGERHFQRENAIKEIGKNHADLISNEDLSTFFDKTFDDEYALDRHVSRDRHWL